MRNLKTIEGKVKAILEKDEEARNDDKLVNAVCISALLYELIFQLHKAM